MTDNRNVCLDLLPHLHNELRSLPTSTNCVKVIDIFLKSLTDYCGT